MDFKKALHFDIKEFIGEDAKLPLVVAALTALISLILLYLIFNVYGNYQIHASTNAQYQGLLLEKERLDHDLKSLYKKNQAEIGYLNQAPQSKSELAGVLTTVIAQSGLKLAKFNLNEQGHGAKDAALVIEADGAYKNVSIFTRSLGPALAASEVQSIKIAKLKDKGLLHVTLAIKFNKPPHLSAVPDGIGAAKVSIKDSHDLYEGWKIIKTDFPVSSSVDAPKPSEPTIKRDPFQPLQSTNLDSKAQSDAKPAQENPSYLLAGILESKKGDMCVVNFASGGAKILMAHQKIDADLTIESIHKTFIVTYSKKSRKRATVHVGEQIL